MTSPLSISAKSVEKKAYDASLSEMNKLQQQSRLYAQREKKTSATYFNYNKDTTFDKSKMDTLANEEIHKMQKSKGWKTLPKSMRWDMIQEYYERDTVRQELSVDTIHQQKEKIKKALISNKHFDVNYNAKDKIIVSISGL